MEYSRYFDHTLLKANASPQEIEKLTREALEHNFYGVCVNSSHIPAVAKILSGSHVTPLTVVGFPLGAMSTAAKVYEAKTAIDAGAGEIDMVLAIGYALNPATEDVAFKDIEAVVNACSVPVKVIIETAYLNEVQIRKATQWCVDAGAAFVKTSTGFASRGASIEDIRTIKQELSRLGAADQVQIKASGGIRNAKDFMTYVDLGVHRIGSSNSVGILAELAGGTASTSAPGSY